MVSTTVCIPSPIFLHFVGKRFFNTKLRWINVFSYKDLSGRATALLNLYNISLKNQPASGSSSKITTVFLQAKSNKL